MSVRMPSARRRELVPREAVVRRKVVKLPKRTGTTPTREPKPKPEADGTQNLRGSPDEVSREEEEGILGASGASSSSGTGRAQGGVLSREDELSAAIRRRTKSPDPDSYREPQLHRPKADRLGLDDGPPPEASDWSAFDVRRSCQALSRGTTKQLSLIHI